LIFSILARAIEMKHDYKIMIIAGEISGDIHSALLVKALRRLLPKVSFFGIGGEEMRSAGVEIIHDIKEMAVMGFAEVAGKLFFFKRVLDEMTELAVARKPDVVILVDYPGFNLKLAQRLHRRGFRIIYYICPQVWAWHTSRIKTMEECIDLLITIFPFEPAYFKNTRLRTEFVGHPLVDEAQRILRTAPSNLPWEGEPRIALLPGSRLHVVKHILPILLETAVLIEQKYPSASFIIPSASPELFSFIDGEIRKAKYKPVHCRIITGVTREVLRQARVAITASGTATIECALMRCPMVIVYRTSMITYLIGKLLVKSPYIGMVNMVAGKMICPEFIQNNASARNIITALIPLLEETAERKAMLDGLDYVNTLLGGPGAVERAGQIIRDFLEKNVSSGVACST